MTTVFVDQNTVVTAAWLNAADAIVNANAIAALQPLSPSANKIAVYTGSSSAALHDISDASIALLALSDYTSIFAALDPQLAAIAALAPSANQFPYFTSLTAAALADLSPFARTILDDTTAGAMLTTLDISSFVQTLLDDANAAAFRTTLGIDQATLDARYLLLAGGTMSGAIAMSNKDITGLNNVSFNSVYDNGNSGASKTIDWSANGQYQSITLTASATLAFTAPPGPCVLHLHVYQDAVGTWQPTLPGTVKWPSTYASGDKLVATSSLSRSLYLLLYDGTNYIANMLPGIA